MYRMQICAVCFALVFAFLASQNSILLAYLVTMSTAPVSDMPIPNVDQFDANIPLPNGNSNHSVEEEEEGDFDSNSIVGPLICDSNSSDHDNDEDDYKPAVYPPPTQEHNPTAL